MIQTKGYKAFKGILKIKDGEFILAIQGDWVYDPKDEMWHNECGDFPKEVCEVIKDDNVLIIERRKRRYV